MGGPRFVPLSGYRELAPGRMVERSARFYAKMRRRRSVRAFEPRAVPRAVIENCVSTAGTAPSGANQQPWRFVAVANAATKRRIRLAAEREERAFYGHRAPPAWLEAIAPLGTDARKPFLEQAAWLIAVFVVRYGTGPRGGRIKHYYPTESVGIATGLLLAALHDAGLVSLTHTPSPMRFLNTLLGRPPHERPFLLVATGYPAPGVQVPDIDRKPLAGILSVFE